MLGSGFAAIVTSTRRLLFLRPIITGQDMSADAAADQLSRCLLRSPHQVGAVYGFGDVGRVSRTAPSASCSTASVSFSSSARPTVR